MSSSRVAAEAALEKLSSMLDQVGGFGKTRVAMQARDKGLINAGLAQSFSEALKGNMPELLEKSTAALSRQLASAELGLGR